MDQIFTVSQETRRHFLEFYPEYEKKVQVFHNILDTDRIAREAQLPGGFSDSYTGIRILTVGRLAYQKAYDIAIPAMKRSAKMAMRRDGMYWERDPREMRSKSRLQSLACRKISSCRVQKRICFLIMHSVISTFMQHGLKEKHRHPGSADTWLCCDCIGLCGKQRADCGRGRWSSLYADTGRHCRKVEELLDDPKKRERLAAAAKQKMNGQTEEIWKLLNLMK